MKLPTLPFDGWDVAGLTAIALITGGTSALAGPAWGSILLGMVIGGLYVLRESSLRRRAR